MARWTLRPLPAARVVPGHRHRSGQPRPHLKPAPAGPGPTSVRCHIADGTAGFPERAPYDRMVAWCTPPLLPTAWAHQVVDGGLLHRGDRALDSSHLTTADACHRARTPSPLTPAGPPRSRRGRPSAPPAPA
ncbi:hypothetical protein LHJ74_00410 [Streptomyces sp. N2-109]|uniref:Uncharacterized protein n=1 Tax=Streptomyces gossypii TaxID=2883101 RepID=A0ABT2JKV8_9ACTN|nr:hypothetical protein [Streptomyces gossypii]MCT2588421.1 hypothetical protein [Streptomyces gossypii]